MYVRRLREKIETDPENPMHLKTVRGAGYLFETRVSGGHLPDRLPAQIHLSYYGVQAIRLAYREIHQKMPIRY